MKMKTKKLIYVSLLAASLIMAVRSFSGIGHSGINLVETLGDSPYLASQESGSIPPAFQGYSEEQLRSMGYSPKQAAPGSGWSLSGSQYDVRGEYYSTDDYLTQEKEWNELSRVR